MANFILLLAILVLNLKDCVARKDFMEIEFEIPGIHHDSNSTIINVSLVNPHGISKREQSACRYPQQVKDYALNCKLYSNKVACTQTCPFGETFPEGIQREMTCFFEENEWGPTKTFEKCKPFVDCSLKMRYGGDMKCYEHYLHRGPRCTISCPPFQNQAPVKAATYSCSINGKWKPELPFCAKPGSAKKLVPAPKGVKVVSFVDE